MFRKLRLFNMFSSLFRANFQNATHLIGVALSAFHRIPNPLQCLGQGCARAGDVDPLEAATAVSEDLAAVEPQLRLVDDQVFQFVDRKPRLAEIEPYEICSLQVDHLHARNLLLHILPCFVQIHQSFIINIDYLMIIKDGKCVLYPPFENVDELLVSKKYKKELQDRYCL